MKTIAITLSCLLYSVVLVAQMNSKSLDSTSVPSYNMKNNYTEGLHDTSNKNLLYLPDSIIRTGLFGGVDIIRFKKIFTHDFNGNELETIEFVESYMYNVWDSLYKNITIYSAFNKPTQNTSFNYDDSVQEWEKESKRDYSYNSLHDITDLTISSWHASTESWHANNKIEYFYSNANLDEKYTWIWDNYTQNWKNTHRKDYYYNTDNSIDYTITNTWNESVQEWNYYLRTDYFYNSIFDLYLLENYQWDGSNQEWQFQYEIEFFYNSNAQVYQKIREGYQGQKNEYSYYSHGNLKQEDISDWNTITNNWDWHDKYVWYYTLQEVADLAENGIKTLSVFPNPTNNEIQFMNLTDKQVHLVTIYNLQGAKLFTKILENGRIRLSTLKAGIYIYKIQNNTSFQTGKIIIKR